MIENDDYEGLDERCFACGKYLDDCTCEDDGDDYDGGRIGDMDQ